MMFISNHGAMWVRVVGLNADPAADDRLLLEEDVNLLRLAQGDLQGEIDKRLDRLHDLSHETKPCRGFSWIRRHRC